MTEADDTLRWRLEVLKAQFEAGRIFIAQHLAEDLEKSLLAVRYGPDGKIELSTVDGRVRSLALAAAHLKDRETSKNSISLADVNKMYIEYIDRNLGFLKRDADAKGYNAAQFAHAVSRTPDAVKDFARQIPPFIENLQDFWENVADASHYHIQDLSGSKAVFGGDLFPSYTGNIASSVGLYVDTIVLSDPFWHSRHIFDAARPEDKVFLLAKHAINVLKYKDLATADLDQPIISFSPFRSSVDESEKEFVQTIMDQDGLKHAGSLFDRTFSSKEELMEYCGALDTPAKVINAVARPERLLFDTEWQGTAEQQLKRYINEDTNKFGVDHPGHAVAIQCFGRMGQATDLLLKSRYLGGTPFIEAETSWKYFNWKMEYNSALDSDQVTHLHMVRGLQHISNTDMEWLGNIPPEALLEMRQQGAFAEVRAMLSEGIAEIATANPSGFFRSSDRIVDNIQNAFDRHRMEVHYLRSKSIKFAGLDIGSWIVTGALEIAAAVNGAPTFGLASYAASQVLDAPRLRDIPERFLNLKNAHVELRKSPMGLFFKHRR